MKPTCVKPILTSTHRVMGRRTLFLSPLLLCLPVLGLHAQAGPRSEATRAPTQAVYQDGPRAPVRETESCEVTRIVDGDTMECAPFGRVRLIGMDTPEAGQEPFGEMATQALRELIPIGSEVALEPDLEARDRYGRMLGYIWADGVMVNWTLVRQGYAVLLTYPPNVQYVDWLTSAQAAAREEGVGLWAMDGFACLPSEFRRGRCR